MRRAQGAESIAKSGKSKEQERHNLNRRNWESVRRGITATEAEKM